MSKAFGITFAVVALVIGGLIWFGFDYTKGNHLAPTGSIGKVRTIKAADDVTFMVIDFKVRNDSDRDMVVRSMETAFATPDGGFVTGGSVAVADITGAAGLVGQNLVLLLRERGARDRCKVADEHCGTANTRRGDAGGQAVQVRFSARPSYHHRPQGYPRTN